MGNRLFFSFVVFVAILGLIDAGKRSKCAGKKYQKKVKRYEKCLKQGFSSKLGCKSGNGKLSGKKALKKCKKMEKQLKKCSYKCKVAAIDGGWSDFSKWSECSAKCGGGYQSRSRSCTNPVPANGGVECEGEAKESQKCNADPCPVDGGWSDFGVWSKCSGVCGGGSQSRSRSCNNPSPANGGAKCRGEAEEVRDCTGDCLAEYTIVLMTSDESDAGTDDKVYMTILGTERDTPEIYIHDPQKNDRERGNTDIHTLTLPNLGDIKCAQFRISGSDGWNIEQVGIKKNGKAAYNSGELGVWLDDKETKRFCVKDALYQVSLTTSDDSYASSGDKLYMTILGTEGDTLETKIDDSRKRANTDSHTLTLQDVGDIKCVQFRIGGSDGWKVEQVGIKKNGKTAFDSGELGVWLDADHDATKRFCVKNVTYQVDLTTSDESNAGSDDKVYMTILGTEGETLETKIDDTKKNDRQRGNTDSHTLTLQDVGDIKCAQFRIGGSDGWKVQQVKIKENGKAAFDSGELGVWLDDKVTKRFCGNEDVKYQLDLTTSDESNAGSDDKVYMTILGTEGDTLETKIDDTEKNDRQRGNTDSHILFLQDVGDIKCVQFRIGGSDGWKVQQVNILGKNGAVFNSGELGIWLDDKETKWFCAN